MERGTPEGAHQPTPEASEIDEAQIERLPERLGFVETGELTQLKAELVEALLQENAERAIDATTRYLALGRQLVDELQGDEAFSEAQIGLSVRMALIRREGGLLEDYLLDLEEACMYAQNYVHIKGVNLDEVIALLEDAMAEAEGGY